MSLWTVLWSFLSGLFARPKPVPPEDDLPPAKVAIIGAGIGGCFAAKFLRENGGKKLDIHVFAKKGSKVGGRTGVCQLDGHQYETGASVIHSDNKYLSDAAKKHGLTRKGELNPSVPVGIFNGTSMFRTGAYQIVNFVKMLWRYGFDLFRMNSSISSLLKKFHNIYGLQASGKTYTNVEDMLEAMGEDMSKLMKVSTEEYMLNELHWNKTLVNELITGALRVNYGQGTSVDAFTAFVSLAGMQDSKLWSVVGGNYKIAESVLNESAYTSLVMDDVVSVIKKDDNGSVMYTIVTEDGTVDEGYDVVIVANPLNLSSTKYENFSSDVYTAAATTPYQRTVATFIKGEINQEIFGEKADVKNFPLIILTTDSDSLPFKFNSVAVEIPSEIQQNEVKKYVVPLQDEPTRVWKVFSPQPLTQDQCRYLFSKFDEDSMACYDWMAYPQYHPPELAPSFVLEDGVFYINAIEKAASAMEMSAIGAKNAALLARDYLLCHYKGKDD